MTNQPDIQAIDVVVNLPTPEALQYRPADREDFYTRKMGVDNNTYKGISLDQLLQRMDAANIERSFLIAAKCGPLGPPETYHIPYELVFQAVKSFPDRFSGIAGLDPTEGMKGVGELKRAVEEYGFIGAHCYPHWFELPPDHAKWYPFYAKCVELNIPLQLQVGQSLIYSKSRPLRSVGRPITLDSVACDFPELAIIGIHIGIPWTDEMIAMAWKHDNVFIGSDAHSPKYWPEQFVHYINTYGQNKVLFATDFPILEFDRTRKEINSLNLRSEAKIKFFRENALRVYKIS